jgi:hypothetical protein
MQTAFYVVAIYGLIFFLIQRRRFDFVSASFFGQLIYFMPGFTGFVLNPYFPWQDPSIPIADGAYMIWIFAMSATILTGYLYRPHTIEAWGKLETRTTFDVALIGTIFISFALMMYFNGDAVLSPDKFEVLEGIGRWFLLFSAASQLAFVCFVAQGKLVRALVPLGGLAFLLYIGFRNDFALSIIALATYFAGRKGVWIYIKLRNIIPITLTAIVLLTYKPILNAWRAGRIDVVYNIFDRDEFLRSSIMGSEPFVTQSVLNEVIIRNLTIEPVTILYSFIASVPFLAPLAGLRTSDLTFTFQEQLFPNLTYGVAANIYAHFYATIGVVGVILFVIAHNWALVKISKRMATAGAPLKLVLLGLGAFLAFYIQRNDLSNSFSIMNRVLITVLVAWLLSKFLESQSRPHERGLPMLPTRAPARPRPAPTPTEHG